MDCETNVKAITPYEATRQSQRTKIKAEVIVAFNELIVENLRDGEAVISQKDVVDRIMQKIKCERQVIFDSHWLDIEDIYRKQGWEVIYEKPGFNESGEAWFTFKTKRNGK